MTKEEIIEAIKAGKARELDLKGIDLSRANLMGADLMGADLSGANLRGAFLYKIQEKEVLTFSAGKDFAYFADGIIKIGCESKSPQEWLEHGQKLAQKYGYSEKEIQLYKSFIEMCINSQN